MSTQTMPKTKHPRTAYAHFLKDKDVRAALKESLSDQSATAVSKAMTQKWNTMDPTARKPYVELNLQEKEAFQKAQQEASSVVSVALTKGKSKRKRARSAYTLYSMDPKVRAAVTSSHPEATTFGAISKVVAAQWKDLSAEEKVPYNEAHLEEKAAMAAAVAAAPVQNTSVPTTGKSKRGRSAYNFYAMDSKVRAAVKEANPAADFGGISKLIAAQWKDLSAEQKAPYEQQSKDDKAKVAEAKVAAVISGTVAPVKIKRARSAYTLYSMDPKVREAVKQANPDADFGAISKLIAAQWKALAPSAKKTYEEASATEKAKVVEAKAALAKSTGAPPPKPKRARSAYTLYSMDPTVREAVKQANPEADFGAISKLIAAQWKALSPADKSSYVATSDAEKAKVAEAKAKNAPKKKRAKTAYLCFSTDPKQREAAKKALGGDPKVTEIAKHLGAQWKQMSDADKQPYTEQSAAEKAKLQAEKDAATASDEE